MTGSTHHDTVEQRLSAALHVLAETQIPATTEHPGVESAWHPWKRRLSIAAAASIVVCGGVGIALLRSEPAPTASQAITTPVDTATDGVSDSNSAVQPAATDSAGDATTMPPPPIDEPLDVERITTPDQAADRQVDPFIYDGLRVPSEAELVDGLGAYEERRTITLVDPDGPDAWWLTVWIVEIDGAVPIYCVGSPVGSGCSEDSPVVDETPPVELLSVGGVPSELVVRARPDVRSIVVDGVDGVGRVAVEQIGVPTQAGIAGLRLPDPEAEVTLTAFDAAERELGQLSVIASEIDPRATGERPADPGRPVSLPPHAPVELSSE